jgi:hypothetical protein
VSAEIDLNAVGWDKNGPYKFTMKPPQFGESITLEVFQNPSAVVRAAVILVELAISVCVL